MKDRQKFSREFKLAAVMKAVEQALPAAEVARDWGIRDSLLHTWKRKLETEGALRLPESASRGPTHLHQVEARPPAAFLPDQELRSGCELARCFPSECRCEAQEGLPPLRYLPRHTLPRHPVVSFSVVKRSLEIF